MIDQILDQILKSRPTYLVSKATCGTKRPRSLVLYIYLCRYHGKLRSGKLMETRDRHGPGLRDRYTRIQKSILWLNANEETLVRVIALYCRNACSPAFPFTALSIFRLFSRGFSHFVRQLPRNSEMTDLLYSRREQ